jgi:hypothetical protein
MPDRHVTCLVLLHRGPRKSFHDRIAEKLATDPEWA